MVAGSTSDWLPPGFTEKIKIKNGRKIKYYHNVATGVRYDSKKDVILYSKTKEFFNEKSLERNNDDDGLSSNNEMDAISEKRNESPEWLPDGWRMEERSRKSGAQEGSKYKVYIEMSTGKKFYSRQAIARHLKNVDSNVGVTKQPKFENMDESLLTSLQTKSLTKDSCIPGKVLGREQSLSVVATEGTSAGGLPPSETDHARGKKLKGKKPFTVVAIESTSADGLPPGWVKEIKISKSGNKIRKYPYYIDPVSRYVFLSKKDALRYLETNNIGSCAITPKMKEEFNGPKLNKNEITVAAESAHIDGLQSGRMREIKTRKSRNKNTEETIAAESTPSDGLESGRMKDMKTRKYGNRNARDKLDNVTLTLAMPIKSLEYKSMEDEGCMPKTKKRKSSFVTVATESTSADGLPPGWIKEIKTSKSGNNIRKDPYYIDPVSGYEFRSKKDVLRYLETNELGSCAIMPKRRRLIENGIPLDKIVETSMKPTLNPQCTTMTDEGPVHTTKNSSKQSSIVVATESTSAEGLPAGWIRTIQTSKSGFKIRNDPYYSDPVSGYVFRSKKDAMRYLRTNDIHSCAIKPKRREFYDFKLTEPKFHAVTESTSAEGLPAGWIRTIQTSKSGNKIRNDLYYTDPVSGYVFRSKKDAMRYLRTNDIRSCAIKPKRREFYDFKLTEPKFHLDNAGEPFVDSDISLQNKSMKDASCITKPQNKNLMIANELTSVDGLPPGWMKEIKISKSGNKIRKDPYYTNLASGYMFRSKKDVLRFLETNDIGSCAITPKKRESDDLNSIKNKTPMSEGLMFDTSGEPFLKPDVSLQSKSMVDEASITKTQKMDRQSSTMIATETTSVDGLPPGWTKEIKIRNSGNKIRKDQYYTDPVSGYIFRSKKDVLRFLKMNDIGSCAVTPNKSNSDGLKLIENKTPRDNIGEPSSKPDIFMQDQSEADAECIPKTRKKYQHSFTTVSTEVTSADGLPPGWIKEIKTSQSGDKIRKDLYYTDPVSGYIFLSKKDALRFVETNDISSCANKPKKREVHDLKLITNKTPPVPQSNVKLSGNRETKRKHFYSGKSNGRDGSSAKGQATLKSKSSKTAFAGADVLQDKKSYENSNENAVDMSSSVPSATMFSSQPVLTIKTGSEQGNACSGQSSQAMDDVLAICSSINESLTGEKFPGHGMEKRTGGTRLRLRKAKKIRDLNLPLRSSKRHLKPEHKMVSNVDLNEQAHTQEPISNVDLNVANHARTSEEIIQDEEPLNKVDKLFSQDLEISEKHPVNNVEKPLAEEKILLVEETSNNDEKLLAEDKAISKEPSEAKTSDKKLNADSVSQNLQSGYAYNDPWTDSCIEFAFKTLTGDIAINDNKPFPSILDSQEDGDIGTSELEVPAMFNIPPGFESVKQSQNLDNPPANPSSSSPTGSPLIQIDEIPPGFESVMQSKISDIFPASPSFSPPNSPSSEDLP